MVTRLRRQLTTHAAKGKTKTKRYLTQHLTTNKSYFSKQEIIKTETSDECAYMYGETCPSGGSCVCAHAVGEFDSCQVEITLNY